MSRPRLTAGDVWGGLAAAAVALPQSMGLGVVLFASMGLPASEGALAGLIGATVLCLASGLAGATTGMISAPNGPVVMLLVGTLATLAADGLPPASQPATLAAILMLAGSLQILLGLSGGGHLVKLLPYSVVSGLVSGVGILMIGSQIEPLIVWETPSPGAAWPLVPAFVALVTYAAIELGPRWVPALPGTISGLVGGTLLFHLILLWQRVPAPESWIVGQIPDLGSLSVDLAPADILGLPWAQIGAAGAALAVLASLDCLLTAVVADAETGRRHHSARELVAQGIGQIVVGLAGGAGGGGTKGSTLVAVKSGGRRWPAIVAGTVFAVLVLVGGPVGRLLPISVLSGVIVSVGVSMLDANVVLWLRRRRTRAAGAIALAVIAITAVGDVMQAVVAGVLVAVVLFLRDQVRSSVIHRRSTAAERHSLRTRPERERTLLDAHGDRILIYELRGTLFFATADRLLTELLPDLDRPVWMILHMRRVQSIDLTAVRLLEQMAVRLHHHGGQLILSNVHKRSGIGRKVNKALRRVDPKREVRKVRSFTASDEAMEFAENALLEQLGCPPDSADGRRVDVEDNELFKGMTAASLALIGPGLQPCHRDEGEVVFSEGDPGTSLYLVLSGEIEIRLPTGRHHYKILAKCGPGTFFGEVAFIDPGPRAATAVAARPVELMQLDRSVVDTLAGQRLDAAALELLFELAAAQSRKLRWTAAELHRLEQW